MGDSNQIWIEKADMVVSDMAAGGLMNEEQSQDLFLIAVEKSVLLQLVTFKAMACNKFEIPKLGFTGMVLRAAVEGQGLSEADRAKATFGKSSLETKEFIAEVRVPYGALEDHITQGTLMNHLKESLGKSIARDIERISIESDTAGSGVPALKQINGFLKLATSYVIAAGGVRLTKSVLKYIIQTQPDQYYEGGANMAFFTSKNAAIDYGDSRSNRQTTMGDAQWTNLTDLEYNSSPVLAVPMFPETLGGGDETNVLFAQPKNLWVGMQREVTVDTAKDISAREYVVVATLKMDANYAHEPGIVKATGVLASAAA